MNDPFVIFWAILIAASIGWYGFLVFYVGFKASRDITAMKKALLHDTRRRDSRTNDTP